MGVLGVCPERAGGCRDGAGQKWDKHRASLGLPFEYRVEGTMWDYLHFNAKEKERMQGCNCWDK